MKKYLVIGNPIEHSLSPKLHNHWFKKNKINASYEKKQLEEKNIKNIINEIKNGNIDGINVTVPFKKSVIPFIEQLSPEAKESQSVNTIVKENNSIVGHNTDIVGFELGIKNINYDVKNKKILILGAGGVVSSIVIALKKMGAFKITISNRTKEKAENLKKIYSNLETVDWGTIPDFDMIINATSVGLKSDQEIKLDYPNIGPNKLFYDVIYNPSQTNFLLKAKKSGNQIENGKMMFIYQALKAFEIWHKVMPKVDNETISLLDL
tara:strand:- start:1561 stop:2355 length:795 start_codon:yes stop_codon:yes gene_type:complete